MSEVRVAAGHKANLSNPNTSDESKQHSAEVLESKANESVDIGDKNRNNVVGGLKAALVNPNVSDEARDSAQDKLEKLGI